MYIDLFDTNSTLCWEWQRAFEGLPVRVLNCSLEQLSSYDYLVTPGNSFGAMSGGLDLAVRNVLGYDFQDNLQMWIMTNFPYGLPVGDIAIIETLDDTKFKNVMYTPTMRTPSSVDAFTVMHIMARITMQAISRPDKSFAIPGLGTGCGCLYPRDAAFAMRAGYDACQFFSRSIYGLQRPS